MSHLIQLREQIKTIQVTKKITHAVRLVSMSLYGKLDKRSNALKNYRAQLEKTYSLLYSQHPSWQNSLFLPKKTATAKPLIIIVSTAKGLCGSLNANLFRYLENSLQEESFNNSEFIAIGSRGAKFLKKSGHTPITHIYTELTSNNYESIANTLTDKIFSESATYSNVIFYSNSSKNFFTQTPKKTALLPISTNTQPSNDHRLADLIWEQEASTILTKLATQYARSIILEILFQALLAEHAARFLAMDSSTTNAEKYLERLTVHYNKTRQALITREVTELTTLDESNY